MRVGEQARARVGGEFKLDESMKEGREEGRKEGRKGGREGGRRKGRTEDFYLIISIR